eukprot:CAMPEP_0185559182 /NCGR_PEP_ID=MMETSP1381-20130426/53989_1 /TAXON_ID=298111 /ORGANISM="Pavlova sp., Strain CCMP459" /LENGTH=114 /DNA_ID=CAMNT_0028172787 /DNA_START=76 /DNA_END=420 /DNA_ORIENTATION=+
MIEMAVAKLLSRLSAYLTVDATTSPPMALSATASQTQESKPVSRPPVLTCAESFMRKMSDWGTVKAASWTLRTQMEAGVVFTSFSKYTLAKPDSMLEARTAATPMRTFPPPGAT